jgi:hypothetical protein
MSTAKKNNAREQRRRAGKMPHSTKHAVSSMEFVERSVLNPTKHKRKNV